MSDKTTPLAVLRHPRSSIADAQLAAGDVVAGVRDAFRAVRPEDLVAAVREGPVKAVRDLEPAEIGRNAMQARDAVLEAIAAVAAEIARDPATVPAAIGRLPRSVVDRLPADVIDRLPAPIADRVPAVRRRRRRQLAMRLAIVGAITAVATSIVAIVLRRRAAERRQVAMGSASDGTYADGLDPVPAPSGEYEPVTATAEPDPDAAGGLPGMAPLDETRSAE